MWVLDFRSLIDLNDYTLKPQRVAPIISARVGANWIEDSFEFIGRWGHGAFYYRDSIYIVG